MKQTFSLILIIILSLFILSSCGSGTGSWTVAAASNFWTAKASLSAARYALAAAVANNKIYAIGGYEATFSNKVEEYNPATNTWTTKTSMPTARDGLAAATVNGLIYAIGGFNGGGYLNTVEEYDPVANTWATKANMPTARAALAAVTANGMIYAIGGSNGVALDTVEAYNPATNTWTTFPFVNNMATVRMSFASAAVNDNIYILAGSGLNSDIIRVYNAVTNIWTPQSSTISTPPDSPAAAAISSIVYLMGGTDGASSFTTVRAYDTVADSLTTKAHMLTARAIFVAATVNGKIYAIGGYDSGSAIGLAAVEEYTP